jgi:hypothetical protein
MAATIQVRRYRPEDCQGVAAFLTEALGEIWSGYQPDEKDTDIRDLERVYTGTYRNGGAFWETSLSWEAVYILHAYLVFITNTPSHVSGFCSASSWQRSM